MGRSGAFPPHPVWYADSSTAVKLEPHEAVLLADQGLEAPFLSIGIERSWRI